MLAEALRGCGVIHHPEATSRRPRGSCACGARRSPRRNGDAVLAAEAINALAGFDFESGAIEAAREGFYEALRWVAAVPASGAASSRTWASWPTFRATWPRRWRTTAVARRLRAHRRRPRPRHRLPQPRHGERRPGAAGTTPTGTSCGAWSWRSRATCTSRASASSTTPRSTWPVSATSGPGRTRRRPSPCSTGSGPSSTRPMPTRSSAGSTARPAATLLAEARLRSAVELAVATGSVLSEAEASRELALLYQVMGRNQEALGLLNSAHRLFGRLDARVDLVDVSTKVAGSRRPTSRWCGTGASRSSRRTATRSVIASGWRATRWAGAGAGARRGAADDHPDRRLPPRPGQGEGAARNPEQAGQADRRGVRGHSDAPGLGRRAAGYGGVPLGHQADHPVAPREARGTGTPTAFGGARSRSTPRSSASWTSTTR